MQDYDEKANSIEEALHLFVILGSVVSIVIAVIIIMLAIMIWSFTPLKFGTSILVSTLLLSIVLIVLFLKHKEIEKNEKNSEQN